MSPTMRSGPVPVLDQRVRAAVDADQHRPVLADVVAQRRAGPPCSGTRAPRSGRAGPRASVRMSGTPTPSSSSSRSRRRYSIVFAANASSWTDSPARASVIAARDRRRPAPCPWRRRRHRRSTRVAVEADLLPSVQAASMTSLPTLSTSGMPAVDQDLRTEVGVAAGDRRRGVDDGRGPGRRRSASALTRSRSTWSMTAMSPGSSRLVRSLVRRSSRTDPGTPGRSWLGGPQAGQFHRALIVPCHEPPSRFIQPGRPLLTHLRYVTVRQIILWNGLFSLGSAVRRPVRAAPRRAPGRHRSPPDRPSSGPVPATGRHRRGHQTTGGDRAVVALQHHDVPVGERGDLGQVGDHEHLGRSASRASRSTDLDRGLAADAGVDLVEHERRHRDACRPGPPRAPASPGTAHHRMRPCAAGAGAPGLAASRTRPRRRRTDRAAVSCTSTRQLSACGIASPRQLVGHRDGRARCGRLRSGLRRTLLPGRRSFASEFDRLRGQLLDPVVGAVELGQPGRRPFGQLQHVVHVPCSAPYLRTSAVERGGAR